VLDLLAVPFLACVVLTGIHAYLGLHVLARGVIFVDLALAQVAALGIALAFLAGHPIRSEAAYWYALVFTLGGAALLAASRTRRAPVPQEAIIGIVYAVSAAAAVLVVDQAPQGGEHIKQLLVGSLLTVTLGEVGTLALLYGALGALHWAIRRPLLEISFGAEAAAGRAVRWWDFVFYASFGVVVTSSVRVAGVLLVFSYLIVPATVGALVARSVAGRLATGWALGLAVSAAGLAASYAWDLPTGATVVVAFGACLASVGLALALSTLARAVGERGAVALRRPGAGLCAVLALAGLFLALVPQADHPWLAWLESVAPAAELLFLTPRERETWRDTQHALARDTAELERLRALQQDVQWGTRPMDPERQERLRQFLASRGEIAAGDRVVLRALRARARERQRWWLGLPLLGAGAGGAFWLARPRRA
jgi:zinc/manganese transport system permease protein